MLEHSDRKSTRASVDLAPRYRTPESFSYVEGRCIDLSVGGMFITARLPCENGTLLKFECTVGSDDTAVKGVARVVWRRTGDGDRPSGMGLKFVKLEPGSPEVIDQLVAAAKEHGVTAPEAPLAAQVRLTESFVPEPALVAVEPVASEAQPEPVAAVLARPAMVESAQPQESAAPSAATHSVSATHVTPAVKRGGSASAIWIALAVAGALLVWLLLR